MPDLYTCPTPCDTDCEINGWGCHEQHLPRWKREHDPDECERTQRNGRRRDTDEVLEAEVRDQLRDQGLDDDGAEMALAAMRDEGMFDVPERW